jgi:hypothetical protein
MVAISPAVTSPATQPARTGTPMQRAARAANGQRRPAGRSLNNVTARNEGGEGGAGKDFGVELIESRSMLQVMNVPYNLAGARSLTSIGCSTAKFLIELAMTRLPDTPSMPRAASAAPERPIWRSELKSRISSGDTMPRYRQGSFAVR